MNKETLATGFVRPKTTSLFFDKIWIPNDLDRSWIGPQLGLVEVPKEVLFNQTLGKDVVYQLEQALFYNGLNLPNIDLYGRLYLFSHNRNGLMLKIVNEFKTKYNYDIMPIFFKKTEFEEMVLTSDEKFLLDDYKDYIDKYCKNFDKKAKKRIKETFKYLQNEKNEPQNINVIEVCINFIPEILEEKLEWRQVLEFRKDKKSVEKLRRFKNWANISLTNKNKNQIIETLYNELEDYKFTLKKHGIIFAVGGFTTILSSSGTMMNLLSNEKIDIVSSSFVISAGIISFTSTQILELFQNRRKPIAYIYDIEKML